MAEVLSECKPFNCEYCSKSYSYASGLTRHVKSEHTDRPDSPDHPESNGMSCLQCNHRYDNGTIDLLTL